MRTVWFSSAILAVAALFAVGCEEDDSPDTMGGQFPSQPGQDGSVPSFDTRKSMKIRTFAERFRVDG